MSDIYWTADTHFFHNRIIESCNRPFESVEEMHEDIVSEWNAIVKRGDRVIHGGDIALCGRKKHEELAKLLHRLNGQIYLIRGNHDPVKNWSEDITKRFVWIRSMHTMSVKHRGPGGNKLQLHICHPPLASWYGRHHGAIHLHGHCHNSLPPHTGMLDVGIDSAVQKLGTYRPFNIDEVLEHTQANDFWNGINNSE